MTLISKDFIEDIIDESDIVSILTSYVKLKKQGQNFVGLSPFTDEKTPSFIVNPTKQRFDDYSSGESGNIINFIQKFDKCDFPEAVAVLAKKLDREIQYECKDYSERAIAKQNKKERLTPVLEFIHQQYILSLKNINVGHKALKELKNNRKYDDTIISDWQIGYAPGNKFIYNQLSQKGWLNEGIELGLISETNDRYFNRIIYPIFDSKGTLVGFSGRNLSDVKSTPKWINPKESILYKKHKLWFGLNRASNLFNEKREVWIVEGYNDVIGWQENGLINTIGSCGTAITEIQINELKKYYDEVVLCMDGDKAGLKSILKHLPEFIKKGFKTKVVILPEDSDPDNFIRLFRKEIDKETLEKTINDKATTYEGYDFLIEKRVTGDDFTKQTEAKKLCSLISDIEDDVYKSVYTEKLIKSSTIKLNRTEVQRWIKEFTEVLKEKISPNGKYEKYKLPKEVNIPFTDLEQTIDEYGLFMANNKIWSLRGGEGKHYFTQVSNFSMKIIQHMNDEKNPMKLISLKNIHGNEKVFDVLSENLNTPQRFDNTVTAYGNFLWTGSNADFQKLRAFLFDQMGNGRKIDVLGWQPDGFWVWNNKITHPEGKNIEMDSNGIFELNGTSYYVPSANNVYKNNQFKFAPQKKLIASNSKYPFEVFTSQMFKVHGSHSIAGILFSIASIFQDYIEKEVGGFPLLFLHGPPSTGKDQLAFCCQSFFGQPQTAINLEGGASTIKGQIRTFAQLSNVICHLSEYKRSNTQMDGVLKGIWDKRGYVRGTIDSHVGTDNIPILCSAILTGNEYPSNDALITRLIWSEMTKSQFSSEEVTNFSELSEIIKNGISHITEGFICQRENFIEKFKPKYKLFKDLLQKKIPDCHSRILGNTATLMATYGVFKDVVVFPFTHNEMVEYFETGIKIQIRKLDSSNITTKFWDCLIFSMRGHIDSRINIGREIGINGEVLSIQFTHCYLKVQREWYSQYQEQAPAKSTMMEALKKDIAFIESATKRLGRGRSSSPKSVYQLDLTKIGAADDIKSAIEWQNQEGPHSKIHNGEKKQSLPF